MIDREFYDFEFLFRARRSLENKIRIVENNRNCLDVIFHGGRAGDINVADYIDQESLRLQILENLRKVLDAINSKIENS